ncbi:MAG: signal peptidase II, partial [Candidatus Gastranaerophilales bacterium]|nr:signal peptidase II [Candidatus Gastranaerophilales bacterium]
MEKKIHQIISSKYFIFVLAFFVVCFDQITKCIAQIKIPFDVSFNFLPNLISFCKVYNTGAAFGIFREGTIFLIIFSIIISIGISFSFLKKEKYYNNKFLSLTWGLILGGTLGNFIDRVTLGYVI